MPAAVMRKPGLAKGVPGVKRAIPKAASEPRHAPTKQKWSTVIIAVAAVAAIAAPFALILAFGGAGMKVIETPSTIGGLNVGAGGAANGATRFYRDMHDGRVMVMEVDGEGTRIVGTMAKEDVPLASDNLPHAERRGMDTQQRLNALGTPFRR